MSLDDFARYPLLFGPSPVHRARAAHRATSAAPRSGPSATTATAAWPTAATRPASSSTSSPTRSRKGCDTLVSIGGVQSNHTRQVAAAAARTGMKLRARAGELGRLARRRLRPRRQHPAQPDHGRRRAARARPASGSASRRAGSRRSPTSRPRRHAVRDPGRAPRTTALGGLGFAGWAREVDDAGARARRLLRHDRSSARSPASTQAGMIAGLRRPGARAARASASTARPSRRRPARRSRGSRAPRRS